MTTALASRPRVPAVGAEYLGQARALRSAINALDQRTGETIQSYADRAMARWHRSRIPRADMLAGIVSDWQRDVPARGRLLLEVDFNKRKKALKISEMRLTASVYQPQSWDTAERGLILGLMVLQVEPFLCRLDVHTLAHIGLHGLARRFQRGLDGSEQAVLHDIAALGQAHTRLCALGDGADFVLPVANGGNWRGAVELVLDKRIGTDLALSVRTFVADGV